MDDKSVMKPLNLPSYPFKVKQEDDRSWIFDPFRRKYVALTPEEWVRQHFLVWLSLEREYPKGLIAVEAPLRYHKLKKRADAIIYDSTGNKLMIIEFKAPDVKITQEVFDQVARYNFSFGVSFLTVTNGLDHYCCRKLPGEESWSFLEFVPVYNDLLKLK